MKNILLLVHEDPGQFSRLQVALAIVRTLRGHLLCVEVKSIPVLTSDGYTGLPDALITQQLREPSAMRTRLETLLVQENVSWSFTETFGSNASALDDVSELADLIVLSTHHEPVPGHRRHPEALPIEARRPMLAVPPGCQGLDTRGCVTVAWDGSRPCNEAMRAGVPLLKSARKVVLLEINQPGGVFAMTEAARYLSRHGIPAELCGRSTGGPVASAILEHARQCHADMIVMGAYGVPRAEQAIFGGTTRTILMEAEVPLLLAH
ncbi:MAG: universal stress protein [Erythrobacter sp.]|nr:MAG: universal stress protein [Erythrobacter sp.]